MSTQLNGFTTANVAEVEATTKALRVTPKPIDYGALGIYAVGSPTGVMSAGLGAAAPIFSFRWGDSSGKVAVIKKVLVSAGGITAFTAGQVTLSLVRLLSFTASDSAGTSLVPSGNMNKLRTSMATSLVTDLRISSTITLTAGTRTPDTNPIGSATGSTTATAGTVMMPPTELFRASAADYPLVFAQNEGMAVLATVPAGGTWTGAVSIVWEELATYV